MSEENQENQKTEAKKPQKVVQGFEKNRISAVKHPWTEKRCKTAASRFESADAWQKGAPSAFKAAAANGWMEQCTSHMTGKVVGIGKAKKTGSKKDYKQAG